MNEAISHAIEAMITVLVAQFEPERIILFGSHARGTATPESDVDLLVVLSFEGSKRAKQLEMRLALRGIRVPKDIIVVTPGEVARRGHLPGTIIRPALREGRVLYARN